MDGFGSVLGGAESAQTALEGFVGMGHRYAVLIDNVAYHIGEWQKVSGLSVRWKPIEYRVGDQGNKICVLPGATTYETIALSRAASPYSRVVQHWLNETSKNPKPQSGTIQLVDFAGMPLVQWRLNEFFPIKWSIDNLNAETGKPVIETLELAHTGFLEDAISMLSPI
ncbi:phage tail-like protein [Catenulispora sp. MAP12-49]|uniref:phage tail protein n=1 Tax=unclassified Catenulispora TaxID=414885 RepID=UPI003518F067